MEDINYYKRLLQQKEIETAEYKTIMQQQKEEIERLQAIVANHPSEEVIARCLSLLNEVETNVKVLSLQRKLKQKIDRSGDKAPAWKQVASADLAEAYKQAGNKITKQMQEHFGLTQPAIRTRLIELGVYESKWSNK